MTRARQHSLCSSSQASRHVAFVMHAAQAQLTSTSSGRPRAPRLRCCPSTFISIRGREGGRPSSTLYWKSSSAPSSGTTAHFHTRCNSSECIGTRGRLAQTAWWRRDATSQMAKDSWCIARAAQRACCALALSAMPAAVAAMYTRDRALAAVKAARRSSSRQISRSHSCTGMVKRFCERREQWHQHGRSLWLAVLARPCSLSCQPCAPARTSQTSLAQQSAASATAAALSAQRACCPAVPLVSRCLAQLQQLPGQLLGLATQRPQWDLVRTVHQLASPRPAAPAALHAAPCPAARLPPRAANPAVTGLPHGAALPP